LIGGAAKFSFRIVRLWIIYLAIQVLVRFLNMIDRCKHTK
jgi:hypothetical protein